MAAALARSEVSLEDRWTAPEGWFYMTGMQALVRLPIQRRLKGHDASCLDFPARPVI
jgi:indolepyruvate ferredoxin oxidoreductase